MIGISKLIEDNKLKTKATVTPPDKKCIRCNLLGMRFTKNNRNKDKLEVVCVSCKKKISTDSRYGIPRGRFSYKDCPGKKYGMITLVKFDRRKDRRSWWLTRCDCGLEKVREIHALHSGNSRAIVTGSIQSCGCIRKEKWKDQERNQRRNWEDVARKEIKRLYIRGAKKRGFNWSITDQEFNEIIKKNCHYCGVAPKNIHKKKYMYVTSKEFLYNGIDRKDNDLGYDIENILPCCNECNYAKSNMKYDEFIIWINRIVNYRKLIID